MAAAVDMLTFCSDVHVDAERKWLTGNFVVLEHEATPGVCDNEKTQQKRAGGLRLSLETPSVASAEFWAWTWCGAAEVFR